VNEAFARIVNDLERKCDELLQMSPITVASLPKQMPTSGVYLFSEDDSHLYVGRTRRLRRRLIEHSHINMMDAPFAFRLARELVGKTTASYTAQGSRAALLADPHFLAARRTAMDRIRAMDIRYVAETDPVRQALLEIYVAVVTGSPYNDFKTT
jgi:hypothetical protein